MGQARGKGEKRGWQRRRRSWKGMRWKKKQRRKKIRMKRRKGRGQRKRKKIHMQGICLLKNNKLLSRQKTKWNMAYTIIKETNQVNPQEVSEFLKTYLEKSAGIGGLTKDAIGFR